MVHVQGYTPVGTAIDIAGTLPASILSALPKFSSKHIHGALARLIAETAELEGMVADV